MEILGGPIFGVAGAGESHGPAVTTIVFGCPAGLTISRQAVQHYLNRRRPGGNRHGTPRNEKDKVVFLSGLYQDDHAALTAGPKVVVSADNQTFETTAYDVGFTTGEPISAIVLSTAKKSADYSQFSGSQGETRPGHTDLVKFHKSRGFVDVRGGGRSSYRSAISDVIGGSIARIWLQETFGTVILSSIRQVGALRAKTSLADHFNQFVVKQGRLLVPQVEIERVREGLHSAEIHTFDQAFAKEAADLIKQTRIKGDSIGAQVEIVALNVPALVGDPMYHSLKLEMMGVLGGLNAAQSCEIGDGIDVISRLGSHNNDPIRQHGFQANSHGGLLGGITTGMPLTARVGFKPTSTILHKQKSVRKNLEEINFALKKGRHDPCVGVRAGVTLESRLAIILMNATLIQQAAQINPKAFKLFE
ncbi:MAG TPA: chorismate synthase [Anaerolineae bacterium]|nr:chorismate synthase [Anaerolineae bacterium]